MPFILIHLSLSILFSFATGAKAFSSVISLLDVKKAPRNKCLLYCRHEGSCQAACDQNTPTLPSYLVDPPKVLRELKLGESVFLPSTPIEITRIAVIPDIFVLRNFLPFEQDRDALIDEATESGLEEAETKSGKVLHRSMSSVAWIRPKEEEYTRGKEIAEFMMNFVPQIFLSEEVLACDCFESENLQIACYKPGGKYDLHHDGFGRIVTVLSYLNGIAGTWFPFAEFSHDSGASTGELPSEMTLENIENTMGKIPGQHGLWVVGDEYEGDASNDPHTVKIHAGDAVVFFNYEYNSDYGRHHMGWRSVHAGMPAKNMKWIATNWVSSDMLGVI